MVFMYGWPYGLTALVVVWNLVQPVVMRKAPFKGAGQTPACGDRDAPKA